MWSGSLMIDVRGERWLLFSWERSFPQYFWPPDPLSSLQSVLVVIPIVIGGVSFVSPSATGGSGVLVILQGKKFFKTCVENEWPLFHGVKPLGFQCHIFLYPPLKKFNLVFSMARIKATIQSLHSVLKHSSVHHPVELARSWEIQWLRSHGYGKEASHDHSKRAQESKRQELTKSTRELFV